jgi:hypothetical protein
VAAVEIIESKFLDTVVVLVLLDFGFEQSLDDLPQEPSFAFVDKLCIDLVVIAFEVAESQLYALIVDLIQQLEGIRLVFVE